MKKKPKRNEIIGRYNDQLQYQKERHIKETGRAWGWKSTSEFKRITKNKKAALYNYDRKNPRRARKIIKMFSKISTIAEGEPYHNVLSYGGATDRIAMNWFKVMKSGGASFEVIFDIEPALQRESGEKQITAKKLFNYSAKMKSLYSSFNALMKKREKNKRRKLDSNGILGDVVEGVSLKQNYLRLYFYFKK